MSDETSRGELAVLESDLRDVEGVVRRFRRALWLVNVVYFPALGYVASNVGWHWVIGAGLVVPVIGNVRAWLRLTDRRRIIDALRVQIEAKQRASLPESGSPALSESSDA